MSEGRVFYTVSELELHWGFIVRQMGASAAQLSYLLPPPPTVVGAFMNTLARALGLPEAPVRHGRRRTHPQHHVTLTHYCASLATIAAGSRLLGDSRGSRTGLVLHSDTTRLLGGPWKGGGSYNDAVRKPIIESVTEIMPVQAAGYTSGMGTRLEIAWVFDADRLEKCLLREAGLEAKVGINELEAAARSVYRLGSRESLATTHAYKAGAVSQDGLLKGTIDYFSYYPQPSGCSTPVTGHTGLVELIMPDTSYRETLFYVPAHPSSGQTHLAPPLEPARFRLRPNCTAIDLGSHRVLASNTQ